MYREVSVIEIREVLRAWLSGSGFRTVAAQAGVDRKTARRYVDAAVAAGLDRECGVDQLSDEFIGDLVAAVRPDRPQGYGSAWESLCTNHDRISDWVKDGLTVVKIGDLLARRGVVVPQRTLHRYCAERTDYRGRGDTVPVVDGEPGVECQIDFARMGMLFDSASGTTPGGACVDLHRGVFAAHVRVVDVLPDVGGGHRRLRGGVAVSTTTNPPITPITSPQMPHIAYLVCSRIFRRAVGPIFRARLDSRLSQPVSGQSVQHLNAALLIHRMNQFRPKFIAHSGANRQ